MFAGLMDKRMVAGGFIILWAAALQVGLASAMHSLIYRHTTVHTDMYTHVQIATHTLHIHSHTCAHAPSHIYVDYMSRQ